MAKLHGQVAIITGASSGIGQATARLFAAEEAKVVVVGRNQERTQAVAQEIVAAGGTALAVVADVSKQKQVKRVADTTLKQFGRIDILLNNAAVLPEPQPLAGQSEAEWDRVLDINLKGIYWTVQYTWPVMERQGSGVIVNTASVIAFRGTAGLAAYCASKAAIVMLTKCLALEGAPLGIRANCVCPGFIDTPMNDWLGALQPDPEAWLKEMHSQIPLNRSGTPAEIAQANLFLACSDSSFMTGQTMILDGGVLA